MKYVINAFCIGSTSMIAIPLCYCIGKLFPGVDWNVLVVTELTIDIQLDATPWSRSSELHPLVGTYQYQMSATNDLTVGFIGAGMMASAIMVSQSL
jgi:hypothetical protein